MEEFKSNYVAETVKELYDGIIWKKLGVDDGVE